MSSRKWTSVSAYWKEGIDNYINADKMLNEKSNTQRKPLTREKAIEMYISNSNKKNYYL